MGDITCVCVHLCQLGAEFVDVLLPYAGLLLIDVRLACCNHLIGHLDEQRRHTLAGVVVAGNAVNHANSIDQPRDCIKHHHRVCLV